MAYSWYNLPQMLANKPIFRWIQSIMNDFDTEIACIKLGNTHVIPVTSPSIVQEILIKQDAIFASRPHNWSNKQVSRGYLTTAITPFGEQWKKMKKVVTTELLSPLRLQWLHDKRVEEADNLVRYFGNGREDGGPGAEELEYVEALLNVLKYLFAFSISDYVPLLREFDLDGHKEAMKKATNTIRNYHDPIIEERIHQWRNGTRTHQDDWLDILISLKDGNNNPLLTMEEIKAQTMELMFPTIDNPYNNVEWLLSEMLNQPKLLQKAVEELDNVVGKDRQV
ncbi:hypothetical protein PIB30_081773 [Stylosanthes scabra]|uniref:Cytochrome P450 n=1 Tax=Stylosanthes scabra TaxID=79078 RepID=A0ABU6RRM0_9FABA|nr:hypothetical protein [Stylosanthes scabra]